MQSSPHKLSVSTAKKQMLLQWMWEATISLKTTLHLKWQNIKNSSSSWKNANSINHPFFQATHASRSHKNIRASIETAGARSRVLKNS